MARKVTLNTTFEIYVARIKRGVRVNLNDCPDATIEGIFRKGIGRIFGDALSQATDKGWTPAECEEKLSRMVEAWNAGDLTLKSREADPVLAALRDAAWSIVRRKDKHPKRAAVNKMDRGALGKLLSPEWVAKAEEQIEVLHGLVD